MQDAAVVRCWGVRGSTPSASWDTRRYGGNTPCLTVRTPAGRTLVFDAGTGVRALGEALVSGAPPRGDTPLDVALFLTHAHWDHVQGLPFFAPLYAAGATVSVFTPAALRDAAEHALRAQMRPPVFPVPFDAVAARIDFHVVDDDGIALNDVRVRPVRAEHADDAIVWSVERADGTPRIVYAPDNEIGRASSDLRAHWLRTFRRAPLLVHDATYLPSEVARFAGWGHSSWEEAVELALDAEIDRLVLFHHHPSRGDAAIDRIVDEARALVRARGGSLRVVGASEGLVLHA